MKNILICGVGGQGTVLASKLIVLAAMEKGRRARSAETIGMAQRGGSVVSHVRFGEEIHSPMIPLGGADVILGLEPGEAMRALPYLKKGGTVIVNTKVIQPVTASLGNSQYDGNRSLDWLERTVPGLILMDGEAVCSRCGSAKVLNVAMLGAAAASGALELSLDEMEHAVRERLPERFLEINLKALRLGAAASGNAANPAGEEA